MLALNQGEKIRRIIRPHHTLFVVELVFIACIAVVPVLLYKYTSLFSQFTLPSGKTTEVLISMYALWLLGCWTFLLLVFTDYYLDMWIITDGRVIGIAQVGAVKRKVTSISLDKVTDVVTDGNRVILFVPEENKRYVVPAPQNPQAVRDLIIREQRNTLERLKHTFTIVEEVHL